MHKIDKISELSNILCEKDGHGKKTVALNERTSPTCRKYKCRYFRKDVVFEGMQLRLLFVQYGRNRTWKILLTTDKSRGGKELDKTPLEGNFETAAEEAIAFIRQRLA